MFFSYILLIFLFLTDSNIWICKNPEAVQLLFMNRGEILEMSVWPCSPQKMFVGGKKRLLDINHAKIGTINFDGGW